MSLTTNPSDNELRQFGLLLGGFCVAVFGIVLPWMAARSWPVWPWLVAAVVWPPALFRPRWLRGVFRVWMTAASAINWVVTRVVLAVVYYSLITPIGFVIRRRGKNPVMRARDPTLVTYREDASAQLPEHMERPF
ncbi:MAG: SxtJ family membrane protein [Sulfurifustaceae bacterium]